MYRPPSPDSVLATLFASRLDDSGVRFLGGKVVGVGEG